MTTQRDRLAAVLATIDPAKWVIAADEIHPGRFTFRLANADALADALLARGVRVVNMETLGAVVSDAADIIAALDADE